MIYAEHLCRALDGHKCLPDQLSASVHWHLCCFHTDVTLRIRINSLRYPHVLCTRQSRSFQHPFRLLCSVCAFKYMLACHCILCASLESNSYLFLAHLGIFIAFVLEVHFIPLFLCLTAGWFSLFAFMFLHTHKHCTSNFLVNLASLALPLQPFCRYV